MDSQSTSESGINSSLEEHIEVVVTGCLVFLLFGILLAINIFEHLKERQMTLQNVLNKP